MADENKKVSKKDKTNKVLEMSFNGSSNHVTEFRDSLMASFQEASTDANTFLFPRPNLQRGTFSYLVRSIYNLQFFIISMSYIIT